MPARLAKPSLPSPGLARSSVSHTHPANGPIGDSKALNKVADLYARANFAMQVGQNAEAIAAYERLLQLDAGFTDAAGKLALLYLKEGNAAKSIEAFKNAKRFGDANGGTVTRDGSGGLQFP